MNTSYDPDYKDNGEKIHTKGPRKIFASLKNDKNGELTKPARPVPKPRDGSELANATREVAAHAIFQHAGRLVSIKDWSQSDLADRLRDRFRATPSCDVLASEAAERMAKLGATDDKRYARGFLRARLGKKSLSIILRELERHGVDKGTAETAVDELRDEGLIEEPSDQAYAVWRHKFDSYPQNDKERAKQGRFMASRGFSFSALSKVWLRAKNEQEDH